MRVFGPVLSMHPRSLEQDHPCAQSPLLVGLIAGLLALSLVLAPRWLPAIEAPSAVGDPFEHGRNLYEEQRYEDAARAFEAAVAARPADAERHLWLGRAYGRMAERASWFRAMDLARQTRQSLERAVELDPRHPEALEDLADYYRTAPGFLGGDKEEAARLERELEAIRGGSSDPT